MYMDSREAYEFAQRMTYETVGSAFVNAARQYQIQNSQPVIVKVTGYTDARMDYLYSGKGAAPSYSSSNASLFTEHFNVTVS